MNVDEAIRELRRSLPGTPDGLADRIVASVTGAADAPAQRRRRVSSKGVLVAASVVAAAAVLLTVALLIRNGTRPDPEPATPVTPPARVDWGQIVTIRLRPDQGISIEEMRARFTTALAFRTYDYDGAGVEVLSAKGDEMTVRLPGSETIEQEQAYLDFERLVILDDDQSVLASGLNLDALRDAADRQSARGATFHYYVQSLESTGEWSGLLRRSTRAAAERERSALARHTKALILAVPSHLAVVGGQDGEDVSLIRPLQVVPSSATRSIRQDGGDVVVTLDVRSAISADRRVRVFRDSSGDGSYDERSQQLGTGTLTTSGELRLSAHRFFPAEMGRPDVGGHVDVVRSEGYGAKPDDVIAGPEVRVSDWARRDVPPGSRWVRIIGGRYDGDDHYLAGAEYQGRTIAVTILPGGYFATSGPGGGGAFRSVCPVGIGTPRVSSCGGTGGGLASQRVVNLYYGRVQPGVGRISVRLGDVEQDAVIENGWWFARISVEASSDTTPATTRSKDVLLDGSVVAWDTEGNPIPVAPPRTIRP